MPLRRASSEAAACFTLAPAPAGGWGVLDASECPPTFSVEPTLFQGIIAGGDEALRTSSERAEDSFEEGAVDLAARHFAQPGVFENDTLVGIAASGRTPYVLGAMAHARKLGALTIGLSCVPGSPLASAAEIAITPATGPEVLTGSTRLKAGTATKLVLNMLSTGVMIRLGAVYGNLMVNVQTTNEKLVARGQRIIMEATGCDHATAARVLTEAGSVKTAIVMQKLNVSRSVAESRIAAAHGKLGELLRTEDAR